MIIKEHRAYSTDHHEFREAEFQTVTQLKRIPFVERWVCLENFIGFRIAQDMLMAELDTGEFQLIGILYGTVDEVDSLRQELLRRF